VGSVGVDIEEDHEICSCLHLAPGASKPPGCALNVEPCAFEGREPRIDHGTSLERQTRRMELSLDRFGPEPRDQEAAGALDQLDGSNDRGGPVAWGSSDGRSGSLFPLVFERWATELAGSLDMDHSIVADRDLDVVAQASTAHTNAYVWLLRMRGCSRVRAGLAAIHADSACVRE
jgi:hypothetical protein